jgi:hypothetical protein
MVVNRDSLITHSFQLFFIGYLRYNISTVGLRLLPTVVNWFVNMCDALPLSHRYTRCIVPETFMDYPAGTVLGIIRIELCFDLPMAIVFPASSQIRDS